MPLYRSVPLVRQRIAYPLCLSAVRGPLLADAIGHKISWGSRLNEDSDSVLMALPAGCGSRKFSGHCTRCVLIPGDRYSAGQAGDGPVLRAPHAELSGVSFIFQVVARVGENPLDTGGRLSRRLLGARLENLLGRGLLPGCDADCSEDRYRAAGRSYFCCGSFPSCGASVCTEEALAGQTHQLLGFFARTQDGHTRNAAADHGHFIATMQARAVLAVLEDLVGQLGLVFDAAKAVLEKEVGDAREQADRLNSVQLGLFDESAEDASAGALALGLGLDDDGAHLAKMRAVKVERAAAEEDAAIGFCDGEVANVFADLGEWTAQQRAIGGERVHQVVDVGGILKEGLTHQHGRPPH